MYIQLPTTDLVEESVSPPNYVSHQVRAKIRPHLINKKELLISGAHSIGNYAKTHCKTPEIE